LTSIADPDPQGSKKVLPVPDSDKFFRISAVPYCYVRKMTFKKRWGKSKNLKLREKPECSDQDTKLY
jgi:hypothetical protein